MNQIKISLVDNDTLLAESMARWLSDFNDILVVNWLDDGQSLIESLKSEEVQPDIVITAFRMKPLNGLDLCQFISAHYPEIRSIVLAGEPNATIMENAICSGAKAFLLKNERMNNVYHAIKNVYDFGIHVNSQVTLSTLQKLADLKYRLPQEDVFPVLSKREKQILYLICREYSSFEIGNALGISHKTVEGIMYKLRKRLGVKKTVGLALFATHFNLLEPLDQSKRL